MKNEAEAFKAAERERRRAASQRRKRRGVEESYDRVCALIERALDDDQDGYRLAPDLETEMRGELRHHESRKAAECDGNARGASTSEGGVRVPERPSIHTASTTLPASTDRVVDDAAGAT